MCSANSRGISNFDSDSRSLTWNPGITEGRLGIRNLNFSGGRLDLIRENDKIFVRCDFPMTVYFQNRKLECKDGENVFTIK